jgi:hypothetical protein
VTGATTIALMATVGGGSLPGQTLPSFGIALAGRSAASASRLLAALRTGVPAVLGRIDGGHVVLDLRTVDPSTDADLRGAIEAALSAAVVGAAGLDSVVGAAVRGAAEPGMDGGAG